VLERAVRTALRRGIKDGLVGGSRVWLALGAAAVGYRLWHRAAGWVSPTVIREELAPGQTLVVAHLGEPS